MRHFIPVQCTCCLILGILTGYYGNPSLTTVLACNALSLLTLLVAQIHTSKTFKKTSFFPMATFVLVFAIGMLVQLKNNPLKNDNHYSHFISTNDKAVLYIKKVRNAYSCEARVLQIGSQHTTGNILLKGSKITAGTIIYTIATFQETTKPYLKKRHLHHQVVLQKEHSIEVSNNNPSLQKKILNTLHKQPFTKNEYSIISALLLGKRNEIPKSLSKAYAKAGVIHILAISGLHVGLLLLMLHGLLAPLERFKKGRLLKTFLIITILWSYALLAGMSASVVRAVTMFTAVAIGMASNRPTNVYNTLFISLFLLLLWNPYYVFDVGFQLSYTAVFAIVWIQPILARFWKPRWKLLDYFWKLTTVSLAAQLGVLPISLYYFHQFPGLFLLSNLVLVPFLGIVLLGGMLIMTLAIIDRLPLFLADAYGTLITTMNQFVQWVASKEQFLITDISISMLSLIICYAVIILFISFLSAKKPRALLFFLTSVVLLQGVLFYEKWDRQAMNRLLQHEKMLVVDSLGVYQLAQHKPTVVLLQHSPRINLERLLKILQPKMILVDNTNYKSARKRWETTCKQSGVSFLEHFTF